VSSNLTVSACKKMSTMICAIFFKRRRASKLLCLRVNLNSGVMFFLEEKIDELVPRPKVCDGKSRVAGKSHGLRKKLFCIDC
jgi:hypothetical protein